MFTGIVEEIGSIKYLSQKEYGGICIGAKKILEDIHIGDSISVNGVCLTVTEYTDNSFTAHIMAETVRKCSFKFLSKGSFVNLERAMSPQGRFGGHMVSGHIDGTGTIKNIKKEGSAFLIAVDAPNDILQFVVKKGSVALDGISLTVASLYQGGFVVSVIAHTMGETVLFYKKSKDIVNIECDMIAKYIGHIAFFEKQQTAKNSTMDREFLDRCGF